MQIKCTDLPGVGRKYTAPLADGRYLVIVVHHSGHREVYFMSDPDAEEPLFSFELADEEARAVGAVLLGADYQPVTDERMEMLLKNVLVEWLTLQPASPLANQRIKDVRIRTVTGATIVGIQRQDTVIPSPDPEEILLPGDVLMVVGRRNQIKALEKLCRPTT